MAGRNVTSFVFSLSLIPLRYASGIVRLTLQTYSDLQVIHFVRFQLVSLKSPFDFSKGLHVLNPAAPTLPHSRPCSTIGAKELNFRVRDGNGCDLLAIATEIYLLLPNHLK